MDGAGAYPRAGALLAHLRFRDTGALKRVRRGSDARRLGLPQGGCSPRSFTIRGYRGPQKGAQGLGCAAPGLTPGRVLSSLVYDSGIPGPLRGSAKTRSRGAWASGRATPHAGERLDPPFWEDQGMGSTPHSGGFREWARSPILEGSAERLDPPFRGERLDPPFRGERLDPPFREGFRGGGSISGMPGCFVY